MPSHRQPHGDQEAQESQIRHGASYDGEECQPTPTRYALTSLRLSQVEEEEEAIEEFDERSGGRGRSARPSVFEAGKAFVEGCERGLNRVEGSFEVGIWRRCGLGGGSCGRRSDTARRGLYTLNGLLLPCLCSILRARQQGSREEKRTCSSDSEIPVVGVDALYR